MADSNRLLKTFGVKLSLAKDPLRKIIHREIGGVRRHVREAVQPQIFQKLPGRLGFNLRSLVDESVLHDGHVFLGFTKCGQFVLSYTHHVEADEHTAYPIYVYRLQWWRFVPYKRLRKISEVRLFGEEEIQQDVFIQLCECPSDNSRVVVHGYCAPSANEEKHQCYVTVTAFPPIDPCDDCSQLAILHMQNGYNGGLYVSPPRCLMHAFTVHTKYDLAPPYPSFMPKVFLKLDGVVIINTGDSLIAISVNIEDNHGGFGFGLYSPRVARTMSSLGSISSRSEDQVSIDSHDRVAADAEREHLDLLNRYLPTSPTSLLNVCRHPLPPTPKDATNNQILPSEIRLQPLRERLVTTGKENQNVLDSVFNKSLGSPQQQNLNSDVVMVAGNSSQRMPPETPNNTKQAMDVYNFEGNTPTSKKEEDTSEFYEVVTEHNPSAGRAMSTVRTSLSYPQGARMQNPGVSQSTLSDEISLQNDSMESQTLDEPKGDPFEKPHMVPPTRHTTGGSSSVVVNTHGCTSRTFGTLTLVPPAESFSLAKSLCSPGCKLDTGSTCSSCISSPIILQSDSQCFTYSVRRYVDSYVEGPLDLEDDLNLAYHSVLPLEVHGANYSQMRLLTKQLTVPQTPCVVVKQLTLDIEHYLVEAVRTKADWGQRYMSFKDYDAQIIDVCPETSEVVALVFVLIRARPPKENKQPHTHGLRSIPKLYQSSLKLVWNLNTGSHHTLDVEDLIEVNQAEHMRRRQQWHPGNRVCEALQRKHAIPQSFSQSVHTLTNEAVFKGQSLKMLLDRHNYVAILL